MIYIQCFKLSENFKTNVIIQYNLYEDYTEALVTDITVLSLLYFSLSYILSIHIYHETLEERSRTRFA